MKLRTRLWSLAMLDQLGPGLVTGAADDDPRGIATYLQAGAHFGYALGCKRGPSDCDFVMIGDINPQRALPNRECVASGLGALLQRPIDEAGFQNFVTRFDSARWDGLSGPFGTQIAGGGGHDHIVKREHDHGANNRPFQKGHRRWVAVSREGSTCAMRRAQSVIV